MNNENAQKIVAMVMGASIEDITPETLLTGDLRDMAMRLCMATGQGIVLNEGDTFSAVLEQL